MDVFKAFCVCLFAGRNILVSLTMILPIVFGASEVYAKESVIYGGGPLYSNAGTHRDMIRASGFTTVMLWTIHVHSDGDLVYNDKKIVDNGVYVGRADWPAEVQAFKEGDTSVRRIEIAIGAWGSGAFDSIRDLINAQGTGPDSILYKNFKLLKDTIPAIDGVSYDDEVTYDVDSSVKMAVMLNDLGYKVTLCPYTNSSYWSSVFSQTNDQRPGAIDRVDLQCYAGGAWNNPGTWNNYFGGLHVTPGLWCYPNSNGSNPSQVESRMSSWNDSYNIAGGFMWLLDDMLNHQETYPVADYGWAINDALSINPSEQFVATLYQHCDYKGWFAEMGVGAYTAADIVTAGGYDNDASSYKVQPGYQITFYENDNFQGATLVKRADGSCLVDDGWNDRVSSMIIEPIQEPVAYWKFNEKEGSIAYDEGDYQFDGTMMNTDSANRTYGKQCGGLYFDGMDDFVEIADYKGIPGGLSRTCMAWIKTTCISGEILSWGEDYKGGRWVIRVNEGGQLRAEVQGGNMIGTTPINDGIWHHIAVVLEDDGSPDITEAQLYVDGKRETISSSVDEPVKSGTYQNVYLGMYYIGKRYYQGTIDEVKIYTRALDAVEIEAMYQEYALMGDFDNDRNIDLSDFSMLSSEWQLSDSCDIDLTCDCMVDMDDLLMFMDQWLDSMMY